jgi:hypothetical protein
MFIPDPVYPGSATLVEIKVEGKQDQIELNVQFGGHVG